MTHSFSSVLLISDGDRNSNGLQYNYNNVLNRESDADRVPHEIRHLFAVHVRILEPLNGQLQQELHDLRAELVGGLVVGRRLSKQLQVIRMAFEQATI